VAAPVGSGSHRPGAHGPAAEPELAIAPACPGIQPRTVTLPRRQSQALPTPMPAPAATATERDPSTMASELTSTVLSTYSRFSRFSCPDPAFRLGKVQIIRRACTALKKIGSSDQADQRVDRIGGCGQLTVEG